MAEPVSAISSRNSHDTDLIAACAGPNIQRHACRSTTKLTENSFVAQLCGGLVVLYNRNAEEREKWEAKATVDRERYEKEKLAYNGPWSVPMGHRRCVFRVPFLCFGA